MFKKKIGNVYTDDTLADFLAGCFVVFIVICMIAGLASG